MRAGRLNRRITIEQPTISLDSHNEPVESWTSFAARWAEVKFRRGSEYFTASQELAQAEVVFRIRYLAGMTKKMRVLYDSQYYDIMAVAEIGYREVTEIYARVQGD
jgi:SPP1 family predicted phage head-tail adaptor